MTVREPVHKPTSYRQGHISLAATTLWRKRLRPTRGPAAAKCLTDELARPDAGQTDCAGARGDRAGFARRRAGSAGGPHAAGRDFLGGDRGGWLADRAPTGYRRLVSCGDRGAR